VHIEHLVSALTPDGGGQHSSSSRPAGIKAGRGVPMTPGQRVLSRTP